MAGSAPLRSLEDRFWPFVIKSDGCWIWVSHKTKRGYGLVHKGGVLSKTSFAHRLSWKLHFGEIPSGMYVCHHCDNPSCVKPEHLFLGTQLDNMRDALKKGRLVNHTGERHGMAKLSSAQVAEIRRRYVYRKTPVTDFAKEFGVAFSTISRIVRGDTWCKAK